MDDILGLGDFNYIDEPPFTKNLLEQGAFEICFSCARRSPKNSVLKKLLGLGAISSRVRMLSSSAQTPTG